MFNAVENTLNVISIKTKSTGTEIVHCQRFFLILAAMLVSLKGTPTWRQIHFSLKYSRVY